MRNVSDRNILDTFTQDFCKVVEKYCKYIIVSGFVAISSGRARGTEDIDMIIERVDQEQFSQLHAALTAAGFVCIQSSDAEVLYAEYLSDSASIRYTRQGELLPEMELKMQQDAVDKYQLRTRTKLELTGLDIWFSNVNVNIAFKEGYLKSDKDLEDAKYLRIVYSEMVDEVEINKVESLLEKYR